MTFRAVDRVILGDVARYRYVSKETCLKLCTSVIYIESRLIQSGIAHDIIGRITWVGWYH